jgi:hypothetical protein
MNSPATLTYLTEADMKALESRRSRLVTRIDGQPITRDAWDQLVAIVPTATVAQ